MSDRAPRAPSALPAYDLRRLRGWRWPALGVLATLVVAGGLWLFEGRSSSASTESTVTSCSRALSSQQSFTAPTTPVVAAAGRVVGVAAFHVGGGWEWCFAGVGTGTGRIPTAQMRAVVSVPIAVVDGNIGAQRVLVLVHHNRATESVVVDGAWARSLVLARGSGFEVLELSVRRWPPWHVPWGHAAVRLGTVQGFDGAGRVTGSEAFDWCPGSINSPGSGC